MTAATMVKRLAAVTQEAIASRISWASMHWGVEDVHPDAWPHIANAVAKALLPVVAEAQAEALREAREAVARQTDLTELMHFDRPSDFRKGVLTCIAALDARIAGTSP